MFVLIVITTFIHEVVFRAIEAAHSHFRTEGMLRRDRGWPYRLLAAASWAVHCATCG